MAQIDKLLLKLLELEGGFVNDPVDKGGCWMLDVRCQM